MNKILICSSDLGFVIILFTFIHRPAHTLNGTACAIPRLIISICETYQNLDGTISIPAILRPYMNMESLTKSSQPYKFFNFKEEYEETQD